MGPESQQLKEKNQSSGFKREKKLGASINFFKAIGHEKSVQGNVSSMGRLISFVACPSNNW